MIAHCIAGRAWGQDIPGLLETNVIRLHENLSTRFKAGDTNVPLLRIDSFGSTIDFCSVDRSGKVITGFCNRVSNSTDWNKPPLNATNLTMLIQAMNTLPASAKESLPLHRQVTTSAAYAVTSAFTSFTTPRTLQTKPEELCGIAGASFMGAPKAKGKAVTPKD